MARGLLLQLLCFAGFYVAVEQVPGHRAAGGLTRLDMSRAKILILDPDVSWTLALSDALVREDVEMFSANNVADALLRNGVRAVVSVTDEVADEDAVAFARLLYEALSRNEPLRRAVDHAKLVVSDAAQEMIQLIESK